VRLFPTLLPSRSSMFTTHFTSSGPCCVRSHTRLTPPPPVLPPAHVMPFHPHTCKEAATLDLGAGVSPQPLYPYLSHLLHLPPAKRLYPCPPHPHPHTQVMPFHLHKESAALDLGAGMFLPPPPSTPPPPLHPHLSSLLNLPNHLCPCPPPPFSTGDALPPPQGGSCP
jgi:hypothetical protein